MDLRPLLNHRLALIVSWGLAILVIALLLGPYHILTLYSSLQPANIRDFVASFGILAAGIYISLHAFRSFVFLPVTPFTIAGGFLFGTVEGFLLTFIGRTLLSALITFGVSRYLFREYARSKIRGRYAGWDRQLERGGILYVAILRMVPMLPFDAVGYVAGASGISLKKYLVGTILGDLPGVFILTLLGSSLNNLGSWQFYLALGLAVVVAGGSWLYVKLNLGKDGER